MRSMRVVVERPRCCRLRRVLGVDEPLSVEHSEEYVSGGRHEVPVGARDEHRAGGRAAAAEQGRYVVVVVVVFDLYNNVL